MHPRGGPKTRGGSAKTGIGENFEEKKQKTKTHDLGGLGPRVTAKHSATTALGTTDMGLAPPT